MKIVRLSGEDKEKLSECARLLLEYFAHAWNTWEEAEAEMPCLLEAGPVLPIPCFLAPVFTTSGWSSHPYGP